MFEDQTALPAQIIIAATEDLRVDFAFQDAGGGAIDITVPGFGDWELVLAPNSGSAAAISFPGSGLTLVNDPLKATNTLSLSATLATISGLMPVDTVFEGDLVRRIQALPGGNPVSETWARIGFLRGTAPQTTSQLGNHIVNLTRNAIGTIIVRRENAGGIGPRGLSFYTGAGAPDEGLGMDGDSYVDLLTGGFYTRAGGAWGGEPIFYVSDGAMAMMALNLSLPGSPFLAIL